MATNRLESLAPELRLIIIEQLTRWTDLRNLCLTSRKLRSLATPALYEAVDIDIKTCPPTYLHDFLAPSNLGLSKTRHLMFADVLNEGDIDDMARAFILSAVSVMADDQLNTLW